jgi:hypothetical protein
VHKFELHNFQIIYISPSFSRKDKQAKACFRKVLGKQNFYIISYQDIKTMSIFSVTELLSWRFYYNLYVDRNFTDANNLLMKNEVWSA